KTTHLKFTKLNPIYFTPPILPMPFLTPNIILIPHIPAALTTLIPIFGHILIRIFIHHFPLFTSPKIPITSTKTIPLLSIFTR
ncbi:DMT family transporter, partial [Staphylococcus aureus]|uniref:DMT family transporter n=1 Tax=Staphylococcus aureus TaxID=1280 RepID=UPI00164297C5